MKKMISFLVVSILAVVFILMYRENMVRPIFLLAGFYIYFSARSWKILKVLKVLGSVSAIFIGFFSWFVAYSWAIWDKSDGIPIYWGVVVGISFYIYIAILGFLGLLGFFSEKHANLLGIVSSGLFIVITLLTKLANDIQLSYTGMIIPSATIVMVIFIIRFLKNRKSNKEGLLQT